MAASATPRLPNHRRLKPTSLNLHLSLTCDRSFGLLISGAPRTCRLARGSAVHPRDQQGAFGERSARDAQTDRRATRSRPRRDEPGRRTATEQPGAYRRATPACSADSGRGRERGSVLAGVGRGGPAGRAPPAPLISPPAPPPRRRRCCPRRRASGPGPCRPATPPAPPLRQHRLRPRNRSSRQSRWCPPSRTRPCRSDSRTTGSSGPRGGRRDGRTGRNRAESTRAVAVLLTSRPDPLFASERQKREREAENGRRARQARHG